MEPIFLKSLTLFFLCLALFTSVNAADRWIRVYGGKWEPDSQMLNDIKIHIESYVKRQAKAQKRELKKWKSYTFQYQGWEANGRKYVFINALCKHTEDGSLDKEIIAVCDGGSCFFNLKYDPVSREFFGLIINGEA